jgi:hypothetical protein
MKEFKAKPFVEHIEELSGTPQKKVEKLVSIYSVYSQPLTEKNFKKYLWTKDDDFEIHDGEGVLFYWEHPILTRPVTIDQFISVSASLGRDLFWHEDVYLNNLNITVKY